MNERAPGLKELGGVWLGLALRTVAVLTTYGRLDPEELYHVGGSGLAGGLGRALVFLNFPVALIAAAVAVMAAVVLGARLGFGPRRRGRRFCPDASPSSSTRTTSTPGRRTPFRLRESGSRYCSPCWPCRVRASRAHHGELAGDRPRVVLAAVLLPSPSHGSSPSSGSTRPIRFWQTSRRRARTWPPFTLVTTTARTASSSGSPPSR